MARWTVLVNPEAGTRRMSVAHVDEALRAHGVDANLQVAEGVEQMTQAVLDHASSGAEGLAVVGGDGTMNFAVNVLLSKTDITEPLVACLPAGTGCDLIRTFGLPQDLTGAVKHLSTSEDYPIDVAYLEGKWGRRYFVNVAQTGVGAAAAETAHSWTRRLGKARYPLAFAARLARFPIANVTVETERRTYESSAIAVIFANAQFFAGGWNIAPRANLVDGVLDLQIFDAKKREAPALVPKIIKGTHLREASVRRTSVRRFSIESSERWPVEADGDYVGNAPVSGEVVPGAVRLKI